MTAFRHEEKYIIDAAQEKILRIKSEGLFFPDPFVNENGMYEISSLYFDDMDNNSFYENEDGIGCRDKYRIRIYNRNTGFIRLEKKEKRNNLTRKISVAVSEEQCRELMRGSCPDIIEGQEPVAQMLFEQMRLYGMMPKVIVTYKRAPYIYPAGNVRLTFDYQIQSSGYTEMFLEEETVSRPILPEGMCVMEVKWDELLPLHLREAFAVDGLQRTRFSKYCMCRTMSVH